MNFLFAWRYFKAKKSTNAINIIAWVSVIAIMVITASFIVLLSVFNGFEGLVQSLYSSFYPDIRVSARQGKIIRVDPTRLRQLALVEGIRNYSLVVEERTLLQNEDISTPVYLKGVDSDYAYVTEVREKLIHGKYDLGDADHPKVLLGSGVENALAVVSDKSLYPLAVYVFKRGVNINVVDPYQAVAEENITTAGTFFIQQEIDNKYSITNIGFLKRMMGLAPDEYSSVEIALTSDLRANAVKRQLQTIFGSNYAIETRYEQNKNLFSVMTLEKWAIYGILTLMLVVAAFTMIGALTMLVLEKQKDIQVLKAIGAGNGLIQKIFLSEGLLLALIGAISGGLLGTALCWAQVKFKLIAIEGGTFLVDYYPVAMKPFDFVLIGFTVTIVAVLASWLPSRKAAIQPIQLRS